jgi:hypothetical protein
MPIKTFLARRGPGQGRKTRPGSHRARSHLATPMVIGRPPSWRRRALWATAGTVLAVATGIGLYLAGQLSAGYDSLRTRADLAALREANAELQARSTQLALAHDHAAAQLRIELGARQALEAQVRRMEEERGRLSQDLALFENLFPASGTDDRPAIRGFRIEPLGAAAPPSAWRYRVLVMRGGQPKEEFKGEFRLQVRYRLGNREIAAADPAGGNVSSALQFRTYQRIEGQFQPPRGAVLLGATARVEENGKLVSESAFRP